jgi:hypothetical protein
MLIDRPGLKFIGNQALLQQVNIQDKLQKKLEIMEITLSRCYCKTRTKGTVVQTAKILGSTIAQVPVNGTGTHFVYAFRTDTYLQPSGGNNRTAFAQFFGAGGIEGAPLALQGKPIEGVVESNLLVQKNQFNDKELHPDIDVSKDIQVSSQESAQRYSQNSTFTGNTTYFNINAAKRGTPIQVQPSTSDTTIQVANTTALSGSLGPVKQNIKGNYGPENLNISQPTVSKYTTTNSGSYISLQKGRLTKNGNVLKENRILLGDQGARKDEDKSNNVYWTTSATKAEIDKLNAQAPVTAKVNGEEEGRDIIKFRFHVITPTETKVLYFRAFLDNFSDNYTGQWNPTKYLGRGEDFQVYGGFQRKITLSFKIAAATRSEMKPLYQKMLYLASSTAPTYAANGQFMRGTIVKMTVGDYVYELPGVMNSVNYAWNVEYPWEIAMLEPEGEGDNTMQELPMIMDCQIDFTPIHTFTPETGLKKYFTTGTTLANNYLLSTEQEAVIGEIVNYFEDNNFRF